jgi:acyl-CoA reductase-like NAD-dependent aldehyde dehydrogenase
LTAPIPERRISREEIDDTLARLKARAPYWAALDIVERIAHLRACLDGVARVAPEWVSRAAALKGAGDRADLAGEECLAGPVPVARNIRLLIEALESEAQPPPVSLTTRRSGQHVATILPVSLHDRLLFHGFHSDVWIEPGRAPTQGRFYREPATGGVVTLVLGAGNVSAISLMDVLHKMFVEGSVVLLKMHPLLAPLGEPFRRAFESLASDGCFAIVYGDAGVGAELVDHPLVDAIHVTGSVETYDRIANNTRPITSELGCVTPVIVAPGEWSSDELDFQARHIASMLVHNASHNCTAAQVLVTSRAWRDRGELLARVRSHLSALPPRATWYPDARARYDEFVRHHAPAWCSPAHREQDVPWTIVEGVLPERHAFAFERELFCGGLVEVTIDVAAPDAFLGAATSFANARLWGTLSAVMLIDDDIRRQHAQALDRAIESLRYGAIGINIWSGAIFGLASPPWGAFPGSTRGDIQSGSGFVHNTFLFDHPQKSVTSAPFTMSPTPVWFLDHQNLLPVAERLLDHEVGPSLARVARVAWAARRG